MAILKPYSYNGTSLQSSDYDTTFPRSNGNSQIVSTANYVKRAGAYQIYAGKDYGTATINIDILCLHDTFALLEGINTLFDTRDETPRVFVATDEEDNQKQYYLYCTPLKVTGGHDGNEINITLAADDPIWRTVTESSDSKAVTDTSDSISLAVGGNDYAYPIFEITPTSIPSTDFIYNSYFQVLPQADTAWVNRPLYIQPTTDTWDTAALIAAGKMQSGGEDIRVLRDGLNIDFQIIDINTTDTKLLVNCDLPEERELKLRTAVAATGAISYLDLQNDATSLKVFDALPAAGRVVVYSALGATDTEEMTYTSKTKTATYARLNISTRAVRNTAEVAHASSDFVAFLPYDFNIVYGSASAPAYVIDSARTPIIATSDSSNSSFVYRQFTDAAGLRSGIWKSNVVKVSKPTLTNSGIYTSTDDVEDVYPAEVMGLAARSYQELGVWKADTVEINWLAAFPDKIASIAASGAQIQNIAAVPAVTFGLSTKLTPATYVVGATITAPVTTDYGAWKEWSKATTDFTFTANTYHNLAFRMVGTLSSTTDNYRKADTNEITVGLSNPPHVMIRTEINNFALDCTLTNTNTSDSIAINLPMSLNKTVTIDTDPDFPHVEYDGLNVNGAVTLNSIRSEWLKLVGNATNVITFVSNVSAANLNIVTKWRDRLNFF